MGLYPLGTETPSLEDAAEAMVIIYNSEVSDRYARRGSISKRKKTWEDAAEEHGDYGVQILHLYNTLLGNEAIRSNNPQAPNYTISRAFKKCEPGVTLLLNDVLISRLNTEQGKIDFQSIEENTDYLAQQMAEEMGLEGGFTGEQAKNLTMDAVMQNILQKNLKLGQ